MTERPPRFYFLDDDPAALWKKGDTGDDLGVDSSGRHLLRLDGYDDKVSIVDPYGRGLIARLDEERPRFSDDELDAWLDQRDDSDPALD